MEELTIPLKKEDFIKHIENNHFTYKIKNNIILFSTKEKNGIIAFAICDNENIKYIRYRFMYLSWNLKNEMVEYLNNNYNLISHTLSNNTRVYEKYDVIFTYSDLQILEATFLPLTEQENKIRKKIANKQNRSDLDSTDAYIWVNLAIGFLDLLTKII